MWWELLFCSLMNGRGKTMKDLLLFLQKSPKTIFSVVTSILPITFTILQKKFATAV